ncbi:MAG: putative LPS assembly protein LptD [Balneolaceae bacterium]|nr:putative LPS assembly protein LptD [Balneolaceae bacterium]
MHGSISWIFPIRSFSLLQASRPVGPTSANLLRCSLQTLSRRRPLEASAWQNLDGSNISTITWWGRPRSILFTSGTFFLDASTQYSVTNKYNGQIQLGYSRENSSLEPTDPSFSTNVQKRLRINHSQTISPYASFSTNINLQTADDSEAQLDDPDDRARTSTSSSINYRYRHPEDLYNFNISADQ